jgi:hypothetical protein
MRLKHVDVATETSVEGLSGTNHSMSVSEDWFCVSAAVKLVSQNVASGKVDPW